jgi:hypothetical protein
MATRRRSRRSNRPNVDSVSCLTANPTRLCPRSLRVVARSCNPLDRTSRHRRLLNDAPESRRPPEAGGRRHTLVGPIGPDQFRASGDPRGGLPQSQSVQWSSFPPPHPCPKAQGHGGQKHDCRGEARQVRLHEDSFNCSSHQARRPGGLGSLPIQDPWLCVPTSRWVCPGRPWSSGRVRPRRERTMT